MEHRHFCRHPERFDIILQSSVAGTLEAQCLDVSPKGMRIGISGPPIPEGSQVYAVVPENKRKLFGARYLCGLVVYATRGTIGLWLGDERNKSDSTPAVN